MSNVHLVNHPLVQHKLTLMRRKDASTNSFRRLLNEISMLMAYEVTRDMPMQDISMLISLRSRRKLLVDASLRRISVSLCWTRGWLTRWTLLIGFFLPLLDPGV